MAFSDFLSDEQKARLNATNAQQPNNSLGENVNSNIDNNMQADMSNPYMAALYQGQPQQQQEESGLGAYLGNLAKGAKAQGAGAIGGQTDFVSGVLGTDGAIGDYFQDVARNNQRKTNYELNDILAHPLQYITDPSGLTYDVGGGLGSSAVLGTEGAAIMAALPASVATGVTGAIGATAARYGLPWLGRALQSPAGKMLIGNVLKTPMEAMSEGGNTYRNMTRNEDGTVNQDADTDAAKRAMYADTAMNAALLTFTNSLESAGLGGVISASGGKGKVLSVLKAAMGDFLQNGYEEGAQQGIQNYAQGTGTARQIFDPTQWNDDQRNQAFTGGITGLVQGGGMAAGGMAMNRALGNNQEATNNPPEETAEEQNNSEYWGDAQRPEEYLAQRAENEKTSAAERMAIENILGADDSQQIYDMAKRMGWTDGRIANEKESFINSIATQESGGNYNDVNEQSGAIGKYQILPENWKVWAQEAGLPESAEPTPENQEIVAQHKLGEYYDKYGARGAAIAWYAGEGALNYSNDALNRKQGDYPSINEYADSVVNRMGQNYQGFVNGVRQANVQAGGWREAPIAEGIEDAGLANTNPNLVSGVNALNTWAYNTFGKDLIVSGGARSAEHNAEVNGSTTSHHLTGGAIDIDISNFTPEEQEAIMQKAQEMGFNDDGESMRHDKGTGDHMHLIMPSNGRINGAGIVNTAGANRRGGGAIRTAADDYVDEYLNSLVNGDNTSADWVAASQNPEAQELRQALDNSGTTGNAQDELALQIADAEDELKNAKQELLEAGRQAKAQNRPELKTAPAQRYKEAKAKRDNLVERQKSRYTGRYAKSSRKTVAPQLDTNAVNIRNLTRVATQNDSERNATNAAIDALMAENAQAQQADRRADYATEPFMPSTYDTNPRGTAGMRNLAQAEQEITGQPTSANVSPERAERTKAGNKITAMVNQGRQRLQERQQQALDTAWYQAEHERNMKGKTVEEVRANPAPNVLQAARSKSLENVTMLAMQGDKKAQSTFSKMGKDVKAYLMQRQIDRLNAENEREGNLNQGEFEDVSEVENENNKNGQNNGEQKVREGRKPTQGETSEGKTNPTGEVNNTDETYAKGVSKLQDEYGEFKATKAIKDGDISRDYEDNEGYVAHILYNGLDEREKYNDTYNVSLQPVGSNNAEVVFNDHVKLKDIPEILAQLKSYKKGKEETVTETKKTPKAEQKGTTFEWTNPKLSSDNARFGTITLSNGEKQNVSVRRSVTGKKTGDSCIVTVSDSKNNVVYMNRDVPWSYTDEHIREYLKDAGNNKVISENDYNKKYDVKGAIRAIPANGGTLQASKFGNVGDKSSTVLTLSDGTKAYTDTHVVLLNFDEKKYAKLIRNSEKLERLHASSIQRITENLQKERSKGNLIKYNLVPVMIKIDGIEFTILQNGSNKIYAKSQYIQYFLRQYGNNVSFEGKGSPLSPFAVIDGDNNVVGVVTPLRMSVDYSNILNKYIEDGCPQMEGQTTMGAAQDSEGTIFPAKLGKATLHGEGTPDRAVYSIGKTNKTEINFTIGKNDNGKFNLHYSRDGYALDVFDIERDAAKQLVKEISNTVGVKVQDEKGNNHILRKYVEASLKFIGRRELTEAYKLEGLNKAAETIDAKQFGKFIDLLKEIVPSMKNREEAQAKEVKAKEGFKDKLGDFKAIEADEGEPNYMQGYVNKDGQTVRISIDPDNKIVTLQGEWLDQFKPEDGGRIDGLGGVSFPTLKDAEQVLETGKFPDFSTRADDAAKIRKMRDGKEAVAKAREKLKNEVKDFLKNDGDLGALFEGQLRSKKNYFTDKELDEIQKEAEKEIAAEKPQEEYKYYMNERGASLGAVPKGFTRVDENDKGGKYGAIYYAKPLTKAEIASYELTPDAGNKVQETIKDFGEYTYGARKDEYESSGKTRKPKSKTGSEEKKDIPEWRKPFTIRKDVLMGGADKPYFVVFKPKANGKIPYLYAKLGSMNFATEAEAEQAMKSVVFSQNFYVSSHYKGNKEEYIIEKKIGNHKYWPIKDGFSSREEALKYVAANIDEVLATKSYYGENDLATPQIKKWRDARQGNAKDRLKGKNATAKMFANDFGFRGVQFGNWNNQEERQELMNAAYEGMHDLAEALGVPPKIISLNGQLSLAFGARGSGLTGAKAHYEPQATIINLTKMKGAGSLAHEWQHAVDQYLLIKGGLIKLDRDGGGWLTDHNALMKASDLGYEFKRAKLPETLKKAFETLMQSLMYKEENFTKDVNLIDKRIVANKEHLDEELNKLRQYISKERPYSRKKKPATPEQLEKFDAAARKLAQYESKLEWNPTLQRFSCDELEELGNVLKEITGRGFAKESSTANNLSAIMRMKHKLQETKADAEVNSIGVKQVPTDFKSANIHLDDGRSTDYWTRPTEMLSRAFSAYVEDTLKENGQTSDFLSYGSDNKLYPFGKPFPEGKERERINAAFKEFYKEVAKEVEKNIKETGEIKFSLREPRNAYASKVQEHENVRTYGEVLDETLSAFPNAKITTSENGQLVAELSNGAKFAVSIKDNIVLNAKQQRRADTAHNTSNGAVQGYWKKFTSNGVDRLLAVSRNSEKGTAYHEALHAAIDLALTEKEKNALFNYYAKQAEKEGRDVEETVADAYRDWKLAREQHKGTIFGKLWQKVKDLAARFKALFDAGAEVQSIMQDIESGAVYERGAAGTNQAKGKAQVAYHGTPYNFDKFTLDNMSKGRGKQAHGWGLYFTKDAAKAEKYKGQDGSVYKVDIPENSELLDGDVPFAEQPANVQKAFRNIISEQLEPKQDNAGIMSEAAEYANNLLGEDVYTSEDSVEDLTDGIIDGLKQTSQKRFAHNMQFALGDIAHLNDREVSLALNENGVKGIKYSSQEDGDCFVIFDDKAIEILDKVQDENTTQSQIQKVREQYEGTDQWLKAPNGRKSNLTETQWLQVRTPAFKEWFGDWEKEDFPKEFLDKKGEPLILYHGSRKFGFSVFDNGKNKGLIFTTPQSYAAQTYAHGGRTRDKISQYESDNGDVNKLIENARNLLGANFEVLSEEKAAELRNDFTKEAEKIKDKWRDIETNDDIPYVEEYNEDSAEDRALNSAHWDVVGAAEYIVDNNNWEGVKDGYNEYFQNLVEKRDKLRDYWRQHKEKYTEKNKPFRDFLFSYELGDFIVYADSYYRKLLSPSNTLVEKLGDEYNIVKESKLRENLDEIANNGTYSLFGKAGNKPLIIDGQGDWWQNIKADVIDGKRHSTDGIAKWAQKNGYSSVVIKNVIDPDGTFGVNQNIDDYIFFNSSEVKSATDNNGNFSGNNEDIRYSVRPVKKSTIAEAFSNTELSKSNVTQIKEGGFKAWFKEKSKGFYRDWFDKNDPLHSFDDAMSVALGEPISGDKSVYNRVQTLSSNVAGEAQSLIEGNAQHINAINEKLGLKGEKRLENASIKKALDIVATPVMDKVAPNYLKENGFKNWVDAFGAYLGSRRLLEMAKLSRQAGKRYSFPNGLTEQQLKEFVAKAPSQFSKAATEYYKVNNNVLKLMENAGLISAETRKLLNTKYKEYCPLMRDFKDTAAADHFIQGLTNGGRGIVNVSSMLKHISIEGSGREVFNPLESTVKAIAVAANRCERNRVGQMAVQMVKDSHGALDGTIKEIPTPNGGNATADAKQMIFTVMQNGKKVAYQLSKEYEELYDPIVGYNVPAAGVVFGVAKNVAQMLRSGATLSPSFVVRNLIRDTIFAGISSKNGFIPVVDSVRGMYALWKNPKARAEFEAAGVTAFNFYNHKESTYKDLIAMNGGKAIDWTKPSDIWKALTKYPELTSEFVESATRMGEFLKAREKGMSLEEAARSARELTLDFSRSGVQGERLNQYIPFFNACLQGGDKMVRLLHEDLMGTSLKLAKYIILPSMLLWALNHDEDWYKELDPAIKNSNWCLPMGIRIPKPQEAGILFGSGIEALLDYATGKDKRAMGNWAKEFLANMTPNYIPTVFLPVIEWQANYSFFRGGPLVSKKLQRLPDEKQYSNSTSTLSKGIGSVTKLSPVKIDNTVRDYTGTMGMFLWQLGDFAEDKNSPEKKLGEYQFLRDFNVTQGNRSRYVNDFYDILDAANKQQAGYGVKGKPSADISAIRKYGTIISGLNKDIQNITNNNNLSPERKRALIDNKKQHINDNARRVVEKYGDKFLG